MHEGCTPNLGSGQGVVDKLRQMGFSYGILSQPLKINCHHCGRPMLMDTFEFTCPDCGAVHGVTPCHAHSAEFVRCAGPGY